MKKIKNKIYNNFVIGLLLSMILLSVGIGALLLSSSATDESDDTNDIYYGPPLDNAEYDEKMRFQISNTFGENTILVDSEWVGILIEASSSYVCECTIDIISPSGLTITIFDYSLSQEEIDNGNEDVSCGQYITLKPGVWPGVIYGTWIFKYSIEGGPATIVISEVISFGTK